MLCQNPAKRENRPIYQRYIGRSLLSVLSVRYDSDSAYPGIVVVLLGWFALRNLGRFRSFGGGVFTVPGLSIVPHTNLATKVTNPTILLLTAGG